MNSNTMPMPTPVRLAPIIRASERETNNMRAHHQQQPLQTQRPKPEEPLFTIYVNSSECRHSVDLMRSIRDVHRVSCTVIDVADGVGVVPTWLRGTPSIVVGTDVYCGDTAFQFVESVVVDRETTYTPAPPDQTSSLQDIVSGKGGKKTDAIGCGLAKAFTPPPQISEEEAARKYSGSVDDAMTRLMKNRN